MKTALRLLSALFLVSLAACSTMSTPSAQAISDLAPTGRLRAVINLGNTILANADAATGQPVGVSVDMARELARQLGVQAELLLSLIHI